MNFDPTRPYFYEPRRQPLTPPAADAPTMSEAIAAIAFRDTP